MWHKHTCTYEKWLKIVTKLALGLFMLYNSFPWLTPELRGCTYSWQHCIAHIYLIQALLMSVRFQGKYATLKYYPTSNSTHTKTSSKQVVVAGSNCRNMVLKKKQVGSFTRLHCICPSSCNRYAFRPTVSVFAIIVPSDTLTTSSTWTNQSLGSLTVFEYIPYTRVNNRIHLFPKLQENMRLIPNMRSIMKAKIDHTPKPRHLFGSTCTWQKSRVVEIVDIVHDCSAEIH